MLNIQNLTYLQGGIPLFQQANLQAFANQRIGLVGKNGCGKSTLFRLIRGEIKPDGGEVALQSGKTIAYVEQEIANSGQPALEFVLDGDVRLRQLEKTLAQEQHDAAWFEAQQQFEAIDGYGAKARAAQLLNGLGFASDALERPVTSFSGGWRMRLNLARALMHRADLLLLDEPTNHLDLDMRDALTIALEEYTGAVVLVSHDRSLIRAVADELWLVADGAAKLFDGDLEDYKSWIEARRPHETAQAKPEKQKQETSARPKKKALLSKQVKLEADLNKAQAELAEINGKLGDPATYAGCSGDFIAGLNARREELDSRVAELEESWLELEMSLEEAV